MYTEFSDHRGVCLCDEQDLGEAQLRHTKDETERALALRQALEPQTVFCRYSLQLGIATNCRAGWLLQPTLTISSDCKILHCEQGRDSQWTESLPIEVSVSGWEQASWLSETVEDAEIG